MKRSALALVVTLMALTLCGCQQAAPETNRNAPVAAASPAKETFDPKAIEAELIKLEREWADAAKNHNGEAVRRIVADDVVIGYPDGAVGDKNLEVQTIESGAITADSFELVDPKVTVLSADSAFLTGRSILRNARYKDPKQKKPINLSGEYRFLNIYARRNGKWQAIASQTTKVLEPAAPAAAPSPSLSPSPTP